MQYNVTTIHHGLTGGDSGSVDFRIGFKETKVEETPHQTVEAIDLRWGEAKALNYLLGSWVLLFTGFVSLRRQSLVGPFSFRSAGFAFIRGGLAFLLGFVITFASLARL
jgi:hypothetical protein